MGKAKGTGKQIINGREYTFRFSSNVHKDNSITARIYYLIDEEAKLQTPQLNQEVILLLEKRNGAYIMTGNWLFQRDIYQDCTKGGLLLERTKSKSRA